MVEQLRERCPLCGAPVSQSRLAELQAQIRQEEREKLGEAMSAAREELHKAHKAEFEAQATILRDEAARIQAEQAREFAVERERLDRELAGRLEQEVARATADSKAPLEAELARVTAERAERDRALEEIRSSMETVHARHAEEIEAARSEGARQQNERVNVLLKDLETREAERSRLAALVADSDAKSQALLEAKEVEGRAALALAERRHEEDLALQRAALAKEGDEQLRKLNIQRIEEQQKWQDKVNELQRQVEKKTADELGRWPEIDLLQSLQEEFQDDRVSRVGKGEEGADIVVEVMHRGESCGKIVIDSKNRKAWRDHYVDKLRQDRDAAKAEHAVLATSVFPSGSRDLCIRDGVVIVRPHGVVTIVRVFRGSLVGNHIRRLGAVQRETKAERLYAYMNSADFRQGLSGMLGACEEIEQLDVDEQRAHNKVWQKRGTLQRRIARSLGDVESKVTAIVEAAETSVTEIAS